MNDYQEYLVGEFVEEYEEGRLTRREALKFIGSVTGSLVLASSILAACAPPPTDPAGSTSPAVPASATATRAPAETAASLPTDTAAPPLEVPMFEDTLEPAGTPDAPAALAPYGTVAPDDPAIFAGEVQFPGEAATLFGYLAHPGAEGSFPVVLVCHENRGLTAHIQDVTRRFAKAGYVALAVDLLSRQGGSAAVGESNVPGALGNSPPEQFIQDFLSGWRYLGEQPYALTARVGMVGFCFGGGVTWRMAVAMPELLAAAPFYGPHPPVADVPKIQAAVLAIYGENDTRINAGIPAIEAAMQENGKIYEKVIYPNADHAFHNDTGSRYNPEAAADAWRRTLEWFGRYL